ncbi:hypothetical protein K1T73_00230 [Roseovarius sp. SCSIO 43702]|uniref:hypothetical protein n=1 Tax=Roseovarius sp. SCSIO 43702 TaxID=2823043 RepID=UPI001C735ABB|nr:hypothetical protein [Roseovarius sp. SCSIO 43702]QYX56884.1 hypothetical protein K1T73_00230 [Roseovarius sp. SCSIO 43702]
MTRVIPIMFRPLVLLTVVLGFALTGFAHRVGASDTDPGLAAYLDAGGSLAEICGDVGSDDHAKSQICEACRLVGAAILPVPADALARLDGKALKQPNRWQGTRLVTPWRDPARQARGPPRV